MADRPRDLSFNVEDKLRTVVWEMAGQRIPSDLLMDLEKISENLGPEKALYEALQALLSLRRLRRCRAHPKVS